MGRVQPGEAHRIEFAEPGFHRTQQCVPQFGESVAFGTKNIFQRLEHRAVGGFVEVELNAEVVGRLYIHNSSCSGHNHYHTHIVRITDGGRKIKISDLSVGRLAEKADRTSEFEIMFYIGVFGMRNLYY